MIPHFPFTDQPFKRELGLKVLDLKDWIQIDDEWAAQVALKKRLLTEQSHIVLAQENYGYADELVEVLRDHLRTYHPEVLARAQTDPRGGLHQVAAMVQEDFCLLEPGTSRLVAGLVCFPSRWKIADKLGKNSDAIHQPVAAFESIARPTAMAIEQVSKPLTRINWTIHDTAELFCPEPASHFERLTSDEVIDKVFLRIERQTIRKLQRTGATAFSIRTYIHPLRQVIGESSQLRRLKSTLNSLPEPVARYKGMSYFFSELKTALERLPS